jgi:NAD-dependent DNA ligase
MDSCEALVALNLIEHVGPVRVRQLLEKFGDAPATLGASRQQLLRVNGIGEDTADSIATWDEASATLASPNWTSLQNCTLTDGTSYFSDPKWKNYPARFYRIRSP